MSQATDLYGQLKVCLNHTRTLRQNVSNVLTRLTEGVSFDNKDENADESNDSDSHKLFLSELQKFLLEVNNSYE